MGSDAATIAHFVACLESGAPFEAAPEDDLQTLRLASPNERCGTTKGTKAWISD